MGSNFAKLAGTILTNSCSEEQQLSEAALGSKQLWTTFRNSLEEYFSLKNSSFRANLRQISGITLRRSFRELPLEAIVGRFWGLALWFWRVAVAQLRGPVL